MINIYNFFYKIFYRISKIKFLTALRVFYFVLKNNVSKYPNYVKKFEKSASLKFNSKFCLSFSSGTAAFYSAILSLNLPKNSNVLISRVTFPSIIRVLNSMGYNLYFFETDKGFQPIYEKKFSEKKFDLVVITHPFGFIVKPDNYKIFLSEETKLIYDCSHTHGLKYNNKNLNEFADISFMSLQGQKAISGGEGGITLTNREIYYQRMIELSHPGHEQNNYFKEFTGMSKNLKLRMHPLSAVLASTDLNYIENKNKILNSKIKEIYNFLLKKQNVESSYLDIEETGGYHYGIPVYFRDISKQESTWPLIKYNWPIYYDHENNPTMEKKTSIFDDILFIDLNWIKSNSLLYIKSKLNLIIN